MKQRAFIGASVVSLLLSSTALQAQVNPEQVWENWQSLSASYGQSIETSGETRQGDTLVVTGMSISQADGDVAVSGTLDEVRFRDMGNGTVEVTMSPRYPLTIETVNSMGDPVVVNLEISQPNLRLVAGGTPTSTSYDFSADSAGIATTSVIEDGEAIPVKVGVTLDRMSGTYLVSTRPDGVIDLSSSISTGNVTIAVAASDAEQGSDVQVNATIAQLAATSGGTFGGMMNMDNMAEALAAGFAADVALTYGALAYDMNITEDGDPTAVRGKADGGRLGLTMDKTKLAYMGGARGVELVMSGAQIPFPEVAIRYAETAFDFLMPVSKGNAAQDFRLGVTLRDLSVSDEVWGMVDPMANLPRDPATLVIDARGQATLTADLTDETAMSSGEPPGTLESINIPALQIKIAGAELTGNGALTFDNTDLETFGGMPAPTGAINLQLVGGNALLDKLGAMGLIPQDQMMGARMMMGMFARPGNGPDTLTSTIEFKDKGFFANGMRLQ
ncbi:MAG: DUF2125 domain-containing protein [Gemmobacter sp.]